MYGLLKQQKKAGKKKIKVIMSDKAMSRETMDARERMLKAALSSDAEVSVDCIKKGPG